MTPDNEIRRQAIDGLYQAIKAQRIPFPAEIREVFHQHMNRLTAPRSIEKDGKLFKEIQVPWEDATDEERGRWASFNQKHVKRFVEIKKNRGIQ